MYRMREAIRSMGFGCGIMNYNIIAECGCEISVNIETNAYNKGHISRILKDHIKVTVIDPCEHHSNKEREY